jgi:hypothetical protein
MAFASPETPDYSNYRWPASDWTAVVIPYPEVSEVERRVVEVHAVGYRPAVVLVEALQTLVAVVQEQEDSA